MLLTRAPLYSWYCYHFLVRLACVRHAASVDSEPGSNSRLKPDVSPLRRRSNWVDRPAHLHLEGRRHLTCENDRAKPDHISRLACSTNLSKILEGGPPKRYPLDRGPDSRPAVLELDAHRPISPLAQRAWAFLREPFEVIKVWVPGQGKNPPEPLWITPFALRKNQRAASNNRSSR